MIALPIEWHAENAPVVFANHMLAQADVHECHLSFFEIKPPVLIGTNEEKKTQAESLKSIPARCVVRVVISRGRLQAFIEVLQSIAKIAESLPMESDTNGKSECVKTTRAVGVVRNGEIIVVDSQAIEDAEDLRASKEALAKGGVKPFGELLAELGLT